jgi:hypothetical protein
LSKNLPQIFPIELHKNRHLATGVDVDDGHGAGAAVAVVVVGGWGIRCGFAILPLGGAALAVAFVLVAKEKYFNIEVFFNMSICQGCQIFLGTTYPNVEIYTKLPQNVPNGHNI